MSDNTCSVTCTNSEPVFWEPLVGRRGGGPKPLSVADRVARFWARVDKSGECWLWTGGTPVHGYGLVSCGRRPDGRVVNDYVHRVAYKLLKGPIPDGLEILHSCDVRHCVNPDHLRVDTHAENLRDAAHKGRLRGVKRPRSWKLGPRRLDLITDALRAERGGIARLARQYGVSVQYVSQAVRRARAATHG